jgi:hypothetical protein
MQCKIKAWVDVLIQAAITILEEKLETPATRMITDGRGEAQDRAGEAQWRSLKKRRRFTLKMKMHPEGWCEPGASSK